MINTVEEKARRYDEAKYIMKEYLESGNAGVIAENTIRKAFPEIAESDDEKIRKAMINGFNKLDKSAVWYNGITNGQILAWLEKQGDKTAWSEEDEKMWAQVINEIEAIKSNSSTVFEKNIAQDKIDWLKYLKDRVQPKQEILEKLEEWLDEYVSDLADVDTASLICSFRNYLDDKLPKSLRHQPKQEWSEGDEKRIKAIISIIESTDQYVMCNVNQDRKPLCDWLKSLRIQATWKPSDEQMKALSDINVTGGISYAGQGQELINLYNALKKLRGE